MKGSDLQSTIFDLFYLDGWLCLRINQGAAVYEDKDRDKSRFVRFSFWSKLGFTSDKGERERPDGVSDLNFMKVVDGRLVWLAVEVKGDGDSLRPSQIDYLAAAGEAGAIPIVAESVDDVREWLSERVVIQ